jgi:hypothetical protein
MISRTRGEHDSQFLRPWRPRPGHAYELADDPVEFADEPHDLGVPVRQPGWRRWARWIVVAMLLAAVGGYALGARLRGPASARSAYPSTPRAWVDAFLASAVDDDAPKVCRTLLSPSLADSYRHTRAGSCLRYFAGASDSAIRIQRIIELRNTAVVELRQRAAPRAWSTVVLDRHDGGWQAAALLSARVG